MSNIWPICGKCGGQHSPKISPCGADVRKAKDTQIGGDHYKSMAIQPGHFIYVNKLNWFEGNAVKYICRHRVKGGRQDIEKAIHYLQLLLEEEYPGA